jgi:transcriptional regulator with XRE-family HTH domain
VTQGKHTPARTRANLTVGASVRVLRELQELSQAELAEAAGLTQPAVSAIEKDRVTLTVDRAKRLALALKVHPAVILFPDWEAEAKAMRRSGAVSHEPIDRVLASAKKRPRAVRRGPSKKLVKEALARDGAKMRRARAEA